MASSQVSGLEGVASAGMAGAELISKLKSAAQARRLMHGQEMKAGADEALAYSAAKESRARIKLLGLQVPAAQVGADIDSSAAGKALRWIQRAKDTLNPFGGSGIGAAQLKGK